MNSMQLTTTPMVATGMGVHRSPADTFAAFVDPALTKRFWINDSTGPLEPDTTVTWSFNASGAQAEVVVRRFDPGKRLVFDWGPTDTKFTVDIEFAPWRGAGCYVHITEVGFTGDADQLAAHATDSTSGFTLVLCSLKALLEHDLELGAVRDRDPSASGKD